MYINIVKINNEIFNTYILLVPDNIYTGGVYYERIERNKWLMMFMVVQKIKVFLEVINMVPRLVSRSQTQPTMNEVDWIWLCMTIWYHGFVYFFFI